MNDEVKKKQLFKYKAFATGLFILMAVIFIVTTILQKTNDSHWIGYVRAFSEAAMVGALADWFAVTALFHYPLGLKIPHTNLIQNSKEKIGDNLGNFVVDNFLAPQNIRPYIQKIQVSRIAGEWLSKDRNQEMLIHEGSTIILDIIQKLENESVEKFISKKLVEMGDQLRFDQILGNGIEYLIENGEHQKLITQVSAQLKVYISEHDEMVRERVKKESYSLIPKFVDNAIADKIVSGLASYFEDIEVQNDHEIRKEITQKLVKFSSELKEGKQQHEALQNIKSYFLTEQKVQQYASDIWRTIKKSMIDELNLPNSSIKAYLKRNLVEWAKNLQHDEVLQNKIDSWIRTTAYKYILKNTHQFGNLISSTVGNWEGKELSEKLELEVGKDLQFIRVNGTIVGGLVGLIIYTITHFFI